MSSVDPRPAAAARTADDPFVVCVVLSFGGGEDIFECLASLEQTTYPRVRTLVLCCDPADELPGRLKARFPEVDVLALPENRGYAGNNNIGITSAIEQGADWVFVLNDDTIVDPDCVTRMMASLVANPTAGIAGPMVYHHDEPAVIQSAGGELSAAWRSGHVGQNEVDRGQFPAARLVDWVSGCAMMVRRDVVEAVGALDERFFMYFEEVEWCLRARRAGWTVVHVPSAKVWHKGVQADYKPSPSVTYYCTRNLFLTLSIHHAPAAAWIAQSLQVLRTLTSWTLKPKWRGKAAHRDAMWRGALDYLRGRWGRMPEWK